MRTRGAHLARRRRTAQLALALAAILPLQVALLVTRRQPDPPSVVPAAAPSQIITPTPSPSPTPSRSPAARPAPARPKAPSRAAVFAGLGAWIDVYDFRAVTPRDAVAVMKANGVGTLYIQTGRHNTPSSVAPEVGPWLREAHRAGLKVVGWYLPGYRELDRDVARSVAVQRYRYRGHRFDGLGIDIEDKSLVRHVPTWNARVAEHAAAVRARTRGFPLAAITPTPIGMAVAPSRWAGFPWRELGRSSDAVMLMSYWSYRSRCPEVTEHCAYGYTAGNIRRTRQLIEDRKLPIHIIGGVADLITPTDVADFVRASKEAGAYGASLYDFRTTAPGFWTLLRAIAR